MNFDVGHTTFGFTMRVPDSDAAAVDELMTSVVTCLCVWMQKTHSLTEVSVCVCVCVLCVLCCVK